jgi:hypothetical protein
VQQNLERSASSFTDFCFEVEWHQACFPRDTSSASPIEPMLNPLVISEKLRDEFR